jgi:hypothetical protein
MPREEATETYHSEIRPRVARLPQWKYSHSALRAEANLAKGQTWSQQEHAVRGAALPRTIRNGTPKQRTKNCQRVRQQCRHREAQKALERKEEQRATESTPSKKGAPLNKADEYFCAPNVRTSVNNAPSTIVVLSDTSASFHRTRATSSDARTWEDAKEQGKARR